MAIIYHSYKELSESGIFRRVDSRKNKSTIYIKKKYEYACTTGEFERDYYVEGDDAYYQNQEDLDNAPYVSYEKIDEVENFFKYLSEPFATLLKKPFKDELGVEYANEGKTLVKAPDSLRGEYQCGDEVEVIFRRAFENSDKITKVIFPPTLKEIGEYAFYHCKFLSNIEFPTSLEKIGCYAFDGCTLVSIKIPSGVTIDSNAFYECEHMCYAVFEEGVEELNDIFRKCNNLKYVILPESLKKVDEDIFDDISPLLFVPRGTMEQFRKILPQRLHNSLREGEVPEEMKNEVEKKIQSIIIEVSKKHLSYTRFEL